MTNQHIVLDVWKTTKTKTKKKKSRLPNESLKQDKLLNTYKVELGLTLVIEEDAS